MRETCSCAVLQGDGPARRPRAGNHHDPRLFSSTSPCRGSDPLGGWEVRRDNRCTERNRGSPCFSVRTPADVEALVRPGCHPEQRVSPSRRRPSGNPQVKIEAHEIILGSLKPDAFGALRPMCDGLMPIGDRLHVRADLLERRSVRSSPMHWRTVRI